MAGVKGDNTHLTGTVRQIEYTSKRTCGCGCAIGCNCKASPHSYSGQPKKPPLD